MLDGVLGNTPLPGELFADKFRIEKVLGRGGMGVVLAAKHVHLHERYALKILLPAAMSDPIHVERFLREGRASVKIQSEHVARVFDVGELPDRTPYLVMELLEGSDFGELLEGAITFPPPEAVDYILQACEAVSEAHKLRIIHRDLKPSNLFLAKQPDGSSIVKVLDFGISKMTSLEPGLAMTRTTTIMGSPLYMSPEQLKSARDVDERSDLWSIGIMLYQLIAGKTPFFAESLPELCALVLSGKVPWLTDDVPTVPTGLSAVIATCLRPDAKDRYSNLAEFADAVAMFGTEKARASADKIIGILGLPLERTKAYDRKLRIEPVATQTSSSAWSRPAEAPVRSRAPIFGVVGVALVLSAVAGVLVVRHKEPEPPSFAAKTADPSPTEPAARSASPPSPPVVSAALSEAPAPPPAPSALPASTLAGKPKPQKVATSKPKAEPIVSAATTQPPPPPPPTPAKTPLGAATSAKD